MKSVTFDSDALWAEGRFAGLTKVVHVQAAVGTADPVAETAWLQRMGEKKRFPQAIIAHADLGGADIDDVLDRHAAHDRLRGIRDFALEPWLAGQSGAPAPEHGLKALAERNLVLDMDCEWPNMAAARQVALRHPELTIVLEHIGYPRSREPDYLNGWRAGISELAKAPNVSCKLSGLGMNHSLWTVDSIRPWIRHCIDTFGPERCLFGTNWPVDRLYSSYDAIVRGYAACVADLGTEERDAMFARNAERIYRV